MKSILLGILYSVARQYFDKDLFGRVEETVVSLMSSNLSGDRKRQIVRDEIREEWNDVSTIAVDTIIQVVLLKRVGS